MTLQIPLSSVSTSPSWGLVCRPVVRPRLSEVWLGIAKGQRNTAELNVLMSRMTALNFIQNKIMHFFYKKVTKTIQQLALKSKETKVTCTFTVMTVSKGCPGRCASV